MMTPAKARRFKLRLENFSKKKVEEKKEIMEAIVQPRNEAPGDTSNSRVLILELSKEKDKPVEVGIPSPLLQVDGVGENESKEN